MFDRPMDGLTDRQTHRQTDRQSGLKGCVHATKNHSKTRKKFDGWIDRPNHERTRQVVVACT